MRAGVARQQHDKAPFKSNAAGASTAVAIAAGALIGPAQVAARVLEFGLLRRFHPLVATRVAATAHPVTAVALVCFGGPAAYAFALLHGAGNGILTIAKGTRHPRARMIEDEWRKLIFTNGASAAHVTDQADRNRVRYRSKTSGASQNGACPMPFRR